MKKSIFTRRISALAVCALGLAALGSAKNPVERPFKIQGQYTITMNLVEGTYEHEGFGVATHGGLLTTHASGHFDEAGNPVVDGGTATFANGDQILWGDGSSWDVEYTGGTGRFEYVTGGWNLVSYTLIDVRENPEGTLALTFDYRGVGIIAY